uniref:hypothetical protein n=1 Tax=Yersinia enterocolitica TaxID=630 RepID=UPI001C60F784
ALHTPLAATSWASCLFAVDELNIPTSNFYVNTLGYISSDFLSIYCFIEYFFLMVLMTNAEDY